MSILRSSHPNVPTLSPLLSPSTASTASCSSSPSLTQRLLTKKKPTIIPLNYHSLLRSRVRSAWSNIFAAPPITQITTSAKEPALAQLTIHPPAVNKTPSEVTVGKRISFSDSVLFSSPKRNFSSSATPTAAKQRPGRRQHSTLPMPISSSVLCKIPDPNVADSSTSNTVVGTTVEKLTPNTIAKYEFLVGASWAPKPREKYGSLLSKENRKETVRKRTSESDEVVFDVTIPKVLKTHKVDAGEDAFFGIKLQNHVALGVADGVGGWVAYGYDPSNFAWSLMNNIAATAMRSPSKPVSDILEPIELLETGYSQVASQREFDAGSSTACILSLCAETGMLRSANLGDSSYVIIRDLSNVVYQAADQQYCFNTPYQLTIVPPHQRKKHKRKIPMNDGQAANGVLSDTIDYDDDPTRATTSSIIQNRPRDADIWHESLKHGDVIVLATDGFFDNVHVAEECIPLVRKCLADWIEEGGLKTNDDKAYQMARGCAKKLTELAVTHQFNPKKMTPFASKAKLHGVRYNGGKIDDVTVLVAIVRRTG